MSRNSGLRSGRKEKVTCQVCNEVESKYTCSACFLPYCSVACFKTHKKSDEGSPGCQGSNSKTTPITLGSKSIPTSAELQVPSNLAESSSSSDGTNKPGDLAPVSLSDTAPLKPLSSLRWPYIAVEEPAFPDPLAKNDPKPLRTRHYEAIATSASVRKALYTPSIVPGKSDQPNERLRDLLKSIDRLSGFERERALQRALGVGDGRMDIGLPQGTQSQSALSDDVVAFRTLAEAIESTVRGADGGDRLGLDWDTAR